MMNLLKKYLNNIYFYLWILFSIIILYMFYAFFWSGVSNYMEFNNINEQMFIFYTYVLPITFSNVNLTFCFLLDALYISILLYPTISLIDYFFNQNPTTSMTRVNRKNWINNFININVIYSIIITLIYILLYKLFGEIYDFEIQLEFHNLNSLLPIIYKFLLSFIIVMIYIYSYIKTDNFALSVGFSIFFNILLQVIIKITFDISELIFNNYIYIICTFILLYILIIVLTIKKFKRRDI